MDEAGYEFIPLEHTVTLASAGECVKGGGAGRSFRENI